MTVHAAQLIARAKLRCCVLENVVAMLCSKAWAQAEAVLLAHSYSLYVCKLKGSDYSISAEAAHQNLKCRSGVMCAFICFLLSLKALGLSRSKACHIKGLSFSQSGAHDA